jgi:hypothetical protein
VIAAGSLKLIATVRRVDDAGSAKLIAAGSAKLIA